MNLPATSPAPAASFLPSQELAPPATASPTHAAASTKKDGDDALNFSALLAMLFPGTLAPIAPTVATTPAGAIDTSAGAAGKTPANGVDAGANQANPAAGAPPAPATAAAAPNAAPLSAADPIKLAAADMQASPPTANGPTPKEAPVVELPGQPGNVATPTAAPDAASKTNVPAEPPGVSAPDLSGLAQQGVAVAQAAVVHRATDVSGGSTAKSAADPKAVAAGNSPGVAQEKPPSHDDPFAPQLDAANRAPALAAAAAEVVVDQKKEQTTADLRTGERTQAAFAMPMQRGESADAAAPPNTDAKPTVSFVEQVHAAVQNNADNLREQGRVELHMDLNPPELGQMRMHLSMEDNQLHIRMDVQDAHAQQVLEQQLQPMRVHFAEMGVSLGQLDVRRDGTGNTPHQDQNGDRPGSTALPQQTRPEDAKLRNAYDRDASSDSLVDLLA